MPHKPHIQRHYLGQGLGWAVFRNRDSARHYPFGRDWANRRVIPMMTAQSLQTLAIWMERNL